MKLKPAVVLVLGAILAACEGVQLHIAMSQQAHDALTLAITVISGLGVLAVGPATLIAVVPHQALVVITALLGALNTVQGSFHLSAPWHTIIAVALVILTTLFTTTGVPDTPPVATGGAVPPPAA